MPEPVIIDDDAGEPLNGLLDRLATSGTQFSPAQIKAITDASYHLHVKHSADEYDTLTNENFRHRFEKNATITLEICPDRTCPDAGTPGWVLVPNVISFGVEDTKGNLLTFRADKDKSVRLTCHSRMYKAPGGYIFENPGPIAYCKVKYKDSHGAEQEMTGKKIRLTIA